MPRDQPPGGGLERPSWPEDQERTDAGDQQRSPASAFGGPVAGETWGRYRVEALLGEGGMGRVYLAHDPQLDRRVALKLLLSTSEGAARRFLAEARAQAAVDHPSVCPIHERSVTGRVGRSSRCATSPAAPWRTSVTS